MRKPINCATLAKSQRAAERLLESSRKYLEGKLKLKMNAEKSKVVSVFSIRNFKFLGFALGKGAKGVYIRAHAKSLKKTKQKLKELTFPQSGQKRPESNGERESLHTRMAWLLRSGRYAKHDEIMGRMAKVQIPLLYMETMEETKDANDQPEETRHC